MVSNVLIHSLILSQVASKATSVPTSATYSWSIMCAFLIHSHHKKLSVSKLLLFHSWKFLFLSFSLIIIIIIIGHIREKIRLLVFH